MVQGFVGTSVVQLEVVLVSVKSCGLQAVIVPITRTVTVYLQKVVKQVTLGKHCE